MYRGGDREATRVPAEEAAGQKNGNLQHRGELLVKFWPQGLEWPKPTTNAYVNRGGGAYRPPYGGYGSKTIIKSGK